MIHLSLPGFHRSTHKDHGIDAWQKSRLHIVDASINFVRDKSEWNRHDIVFEIARKATDGDSLPRISDCSDNRML